MTTYIVADPSGQKHQIQGPPGASPQDVIAQAQKIIPYKPFPQGQQPVAQSPMGGQQQPFNGMDQAKLLGLYMKINPQGAQELIGKMIQQKMGMNVLNPLQQSEYDKNLAMANLYKQRASGDQGSSDGLMTVYESPDGSNRSLQPFDGGIPVKVKPAVALQYTAKKQPTGFGSTPAGQDYFKQRGNLSQTMNLERIQKSIDPSFASRSTPMGAAASSVRRAINGLSLLQQPVVTKTALEATMGDLDSILTQAGATVEGRRMLATGNVMNNIATFRSFVSQAPDQVKVPDNYVNIYRNILQELGPISQKMVQSYVDQQSNLFRPSALKVTSPSDYNGLIQRVKDTYDINKQLGRSTRSFNSIQDAEKANLPSGTRININGRMATVQ